MIKTKVTLGIDIGGTNTVYGFVDIYGKIIQFCFRLNSHFLTNQSFQFIDQEKKKTTKHKMTDEFFFDKGKDESILNFKRS